ncbi:MAG: methylamine utilization protein MauG [Pseudomonadales bacterium]|jgi:cytochrome c peroxidase|nr:methylamine utilization protein MauG [Pseudomonadales bacterium]
MRLVFFRVLSVTATLLLSAGVHAQATNADLERQVRLVDLGRSLFFDVNLSRERHQSCATCHDPARAFVDWRDNGVKAAASLGDDLRSLGDRNAPSASYASQSPEFHQDAAGNYIGGQFWDGRAATLEAQAGGPPLNPLEMAQPDQAAVVERLKENPNYLHEFPALFGADVFNDVAGAYAGLETAIAAFERDEFFSPFDSKYDRYLRGDYTPTEQETLGMTLFFSNQFTNCNQCHQLQQFPEAAGETFTNYTYENIGVPKNSALRAANGVAEDYADTGLAQNPQVTDAATARGRFKVPTLRNVALTAPYMHNGVFQDLRTVLLFYNKYLARGSKAQINPETGENWGDPEIAENIATEKLQSGRALDERGIDALLAFMKMLTDQRYEPVLQAQDAAAQ